jgi:SAM-dependent methyltransferase
LGEVAADLAHRAHRRAVDARLREAIAGGAQNLREALAATDGADPRLVAQRMRALGRPVDGAALEPLASSDPPGPELHALDFEWYFTPACAAGLAAYAAGLAVPAAGDGSSVLCLGAPSVAFALLTAPPVRRVTLVDRNPLAILRHPHAAGVEARHEDVAAVRLAMGTYDVAVIDAPWYLPALSHWLAVAAAAVRPGGRILLALLPALHRPSAPADRAAILARARALGPVAVEPGRLRYATPRFERDALATAGLLVPEAWRRADLVEIAVTRPCPAALPTPEPEPEWARFVVGAQVIRLDPHASSGPGDVLAPIDERPDFRYGSISTRDPRRADIGLWTSRSRVARVRRPAVVAALLERLAATGDPRALAGVPELRAVPQAERARLLHALRVIVGPPQPPTIAPGSTADPACLAAPMR